MTEPLRPEERAMLYAARLTLKDALSDAVADHAKYHEMLTPGTTSYDEVLHKHAQAIVLAVMGCQTGDLSPYAAALEAGDFATYYLNHTSIEMAASLIDRYLEEASNE